MPIEGSVLCFHHPKTGYAGGIICEALGHAAGWNIEIFRIVKDLASLLCVFLESKHSDSLRKIMTDKHEGNRENARLSVPVKREILFVLQLTVGIVIDVSDDVRVGLRRWLIRSRRESLSMTL
jgi:hypothetical protein